MKILLNQLYLFDIILTKKWPFPLASRTDVRDDY
jgi:hypothetical protein